MNPASWPRIWRNSEPRRRPSRGLHAAVTARTCKPAHDGLLPGLVAVYAAENNYLTAWTDLLPSCPPESPYRSWAENWSCDAFRDVVDGLRSCLDQEAGPLSEPMLDSLTATYQTASLWELAFWR